MELILPIFVSVIALISILLTPKAQHDGAFFRGLSPTGRQPGLLMLTFSLVTTWIFARSLMNAAILGFYYGIWGTLAYAAYYLSFLTGWRIIDSLRFNHGYNSVQSFLQDRFGRWGASCYNFVVGIRLISEVFANLLVIGILFGTAGSSAYTMAVIGLATVTLFYSMIGGLHASLRTDLFQMSLFLIVLLVLIGLTIGSGHFSLEQIGLKAFKIGDPGPILLAVAFLQIWSYPMHDPVMMDRGFLSDRSTTKRSFIHAAWISGLCIILFGIIGVFAGANTVSGETMNQVLTRLLGEIPMMFFSIALVISAMSTLDSTLSSSAKLVVIDMGIQEPNINNGRLTMTIFMMIGLLLVFFGSNDLFSAVAVSGTASLYLAPVVFFSLWGNCKDIPVWSYVSAFMLAIGGAALYFTESANYTQWLGSYHKYTKLLFISVTVLTLDCLFFWAGAKLTNRQAETVVSTV